MRGDFIKSELNGQPFAIREDILQNATNVLNAGIQKVENIAEESVTYETISNVAVISVDGAMYKKSINSICMSVASYSDINKYIEEAENDDRIDTTLFRVDTVGGAVAGVDEVSSLIYNSSNKTVTFFENNGHSAGVWSFTSSDEVYASETTMIGSIGIIVTYNINKNDDDKLIIVSKNSENKSCKLNGNCKDEIKSIIDKYEDIFFSRVYRNTGFNEDKIKTVFGNGGSIFADKALESGFIDGISTFNDVLNGLIHKNNSITTATMPTGKFSDKIGKNETSKGDEMGKNETSKVDEIGLTQKKFDALSGDLEKANAELSSSDKEILSLKDNIKSLKDNIKSLKDETKEIVSMAMTYGIKKETVMSLIDTGDKNIAASIILAEIRSSGSSSKVEDIGHDDEKEKDAESKEIEYAKSIAKRMSVK